MGKKQSQEFLEFSQHFPSDYSPEIVDYVTNNVLLDSRYIFTRRAAGVQFGHCTHCKKNFPSVALKHNDKATCPICESYCTVKASGKGRKYLIDRAYVVYYEKSVLDPQVIIARGFSVQRDYSKDYLSVETKYIPHVMYVFQMGNSQMFWQSFYNGAWRKEDKVKSIFSNSQHANDWCSFTSIEKAVVGTPFQYSTWEQYRDTDMVNFFALYSSYPCIEYLTKLKMRYFVTAKLYGAKTYGAINWRGKGIDQVLKLNKQRSKEIIASISGTSLHPLTLRLFQIACKERSDLAIPELNELAVKYDEYFEEFKKMLKHTTIRRAHGYVNRQIEKEKKAKRPARVRDILITWKDYVSDCGRLGMDLKNDSVLFPSNLHQAHQNTIKQVKIKEDEELTRKIQLRRETLAKYHFESMGFVIRAATDSKELIEEGKKLQHCVGTYADRYADGRCDILVIRQSESRDTPFYTMEIQNGKIVQCRGLKNCGMTEEVERFVEVFREARLEKKPKKQTRIEVTAINQRQEVAV
ncbi:PcfJ domain-containing protein [Brevibacillus sp. HB2.2]|uniref:PcfJ domain-containing protein n=1 Tax=Brevibacillus sp. HB2.2 TaxID=2738846 RepID=UPI00156A7535|nr:PcfJ domain-containing protein [Brevibacillus sp. HB2.2]NRS50995.1 PcfJ domain-containing protein [Brevibacillus sp. HB2.2]